MATISAFFILDIFILFVAVSATVLSWITMTKIKSELKSVGFWFSLAITLIMLRKVFDFIGEVYFANAPIWSVYEDIAYLFGILCFLYGSNSALRYFKRLRF